MKMLLHCLLIFSKKPLSFSCLCMECVLFSLDFRFFSSYHQVSIIWLGYGFVWFSSSLLCLCFYFFLFSPLSFPLVAVFRIRELLYLFSSFFFKASGSFFMYVCKSILSQRQFGNDIEHVSG